LLEEFECDHRLLCSTPWFLVLFQAADMYVLDPDMAAQLEATRRPFEASCQNFVIPACLPTTCILRLQAADTYVFDPEMAAQLKASNPQAF
jgi:hypothetical protein